MKCESAVRCWNNLKFYYRCEQVSKAKRTVVKHLTLRPVFYVILLMLLNVLIKLMHTEVAEINI